ncbi:MAG: NAD-dependent epimerase/dehydratase family protein [Candidatus Rokubacteria bacterium]|nr:NAD-dependent epimerase/dehydratase family protein [Candidatus Rokubacteria bacterium]
MGETILVTGAAGFIGRRLIRRLAGEGVRVLAATHRAPLPECPSGVEVWPVDLTAPGSLGPLPASIDGVVHLAAAISVEQSLEAAEQCLEVNGMGTMNLLRFCVERGIPSFIFSSSVAVYGTVRAEHPISESWPPAPVSFYAATKLLGERYTELMGRAFGVRTMSLRFSSVYGPGQHPDTVLAIFVRRALAGQDLEVFGRGERTQDFLYVDDAVGGIIQALRSSASGVFHIGSGLGTSVGTLARCVSDIFSEGRARVVSRPDRADDGAMICLDIARAREAFGYVPRHAGEAGLRAYSRELRGHPA